MVADIVAGRRTLPRKGKSNAKVPAAERLAIAAAVSTIQDLCRVIRTESLGAEDAPKAGAVEVAWRKGIEPIAVVHSTEATYRETVAATAAQLGVSRRTIEGMVIDLKRRIDRWPEV